LALGKKRAKVQGKKMAGDQPKKTFLVASKKSASSCFGAVLN
jgi:hypothetical protein